MAVPVPAGGMILWNSKLMHCAREALPGRPVPRSRAVVYVCMQPMDDAQYAASPELQKQMRAKLATLASGRTTCHWPRVVIGKLVPRKPQTYGRPMPPMTPPTPPTLDDLTPLGRRLAGERPLAAAPVPTRKPARGERKRDRAAAFDV